jgi:hypothetical protein
MDHKRTWRYRLQAPRDDCFAMFAEAFEDGGSLLIKGRWRVDRAGNRATATYLGRRGLLAAMTVMSKTGQASEAGAVGSTVTFEIDGTGEDGYTECAMWLSEYGTKMGFTNDVGVLRRHMQVVQKHLRQLDPDLQTVKD